MFLIVGGRYQLVLSAPQWAYLSKLDVMHNHDVVIDKHEDGSVIVHMKQEDYSIFLNSMSTNNHKTKVNLAITDIITQLDAGERVSKKPIAFVNRFN